MLSQAISQRSLSIFEELATGTVQLKTVKELLDSVQVGHLWILAKIVNLELKNNWPYLGCIKCHKSVEEVAKNTFHCKKCGRDFQTATHRYRVQIKVMDDTGIVSLLLWDNEAITLIEKSASELKDCPLEIFDSPYECSYSIELDVLLDRIIMFRVNVKQENIESRDQVYGVAKINDDEELINQYKMSTKEDLFTELHFNVEEGSDTKKDSVYDNEKISPKKMYISKKKKGRPKSGGPISEVTDDVDQLSSNNAKKVIKKEKNP
ncbi:hypothetical protein BC332_28984 [Capsicum chinense]|nr:hypothetical protein BC332_28984 [Capsicum chinense]